MAVSDEIKVKKPEGRPVGDSGNFPHDKDYSRLLTPEKRHIIIALVQGGASTRNAAQMAGLLEGTVMRALDRGRADLLTYGDEDVPRSPSALFYLDVFKARASFQLGLTVKFGKAMDKDVRAAMAYLELLGRQHPEDLGRRQVMKIQQETTVRIAFVEKDGEEWQRGQSRATIQESAQKAIEGAVGEGNEIIDAEIRESESEDDNVF